MLKSAGQVRRLNANPTPVYIRKCSHRFSAATVQAAWREDAKVQLKALVGLNASQRRAVAEALVHTLTLWQGPPGTGKTRTLLALMQVGKHALFTSSSWAMFLCASSSCEY